MSELINSEIYAQMKKGTEEKVFEKERGGKFKTKKKRHKPKILNKIYCVRLWGKDWGKCIIQEKFYKPVKITGEKLKGKDTYWCLEHPCHTGRVQIWNVCSSNQCLFVFSRDNRDCFTPLIWHGESNSRFFLLTWTMRLRLSCQWT